MDAEGRVRDLALDIYFAVSGFDRNDLPDVKNLIAAALREERVRVIEECAKVALADHPDKYTNWNDDFNHGQAYASDCIRALKDGT